MREVSAEVVRLLQLELGCAWHGCWSPVEVPVTQQNKKWDRMIWGLLHKNLLLMLHPLAFNISGLELSRRFNN